MTWSWNHHLEEYLGPKHFLMVMTVNWLIPCLISTGWVWDAVVAAQLEPALSFRTSAKDQPISHREADSWFGTPSTWINATSAFRRVSPTWARRWGLLDKATRITQGGYILKEPFAPLPMHLTGRASSMPAMCCLVANRCHSVGRPIVESWLGKFFALRHGSTRSPVDVLMVARANVVTFAQKVNQNCEKSSRLDLSQTSVMKLHFCCY